MVWHHQVENLEPTLSINHNWTNGFGMLPTVEPNPNPNPNPNPSPSPNPNPNQASLCYHTLGKVHGIWTPLPRTLKDWAPRL